jgi:hypothetical protein
MNENMNVTNLSAYLQPRNRSDHDDIPEKFNGEKERRLISLGILKDFLIKVELSESPDSDFKLNENERNYIFRYLKWSRQLNST